MFHLFARIKTAFVVAGPLAAALTLGLGGACNPDRLLLVTVHNDAIQSATIATLDVKALGNKDTVPVDDRDGGMRPFPVEVGVYIPRGVRSLMVEVVARDFDGNEKGRGMADFQDVGLPTSNAYLCVDGHCPTDCDPTVETGGVASTPPSTECHTFCTAVMAAQCSDALFSASIASCEAACSLLSTAGDLDLPCRQDVLTTNQDPASKCMAASIIGPICSPSRAEAPCATYCDLGKMACGDGFPSGRDCINQCNLLLVGVVASDNARISCRSSWLAKAVLNSTLCAWALPVPACGDCK